VGAAIMRMLRQAGWSEGRVATALRLRHNQLGAERRIPLENIARFWTSPLR
jgi:hypothetical protein